MSPIDAATDEIRAEMEALKARLGASGVPDALVIRVEFDRRTGMPRKVEYHEERQRLILGGAVASSKRCGTAA